MFKKTDYSKPDNNAPVFNILTATAGESSKYNPTFEIYGNVIRTPLLDNIETEEDLNQIAARYANNYIPVWTMFNKNSKYFPVIFYKIPGLQYPFNISESVSNINTGFLEEYIHQITTNENINLITNYEPITNNNNESIYTEGIKDEWLTYGGNDLNTGYTPSNIIRSANALAMQVEKVSSLLPTIDKQTYHPVFDTTHIYALIVGLDSSIPTGYCLNGTGVLVKINKTTGVLEKSITAAEIFKSITTDIRKIVTRSPPELMNEYIYVSTCPKNDNGIIAIAKLKKKDLSVIWAQETLVGNKWQSGRNIKAIIPNPKFMPDNIKGKIIIIQEISITGQYASDIFSSGYKFNYDYNWWIAQGGCLAIVDHGEYSESLWNFIAGPKMLHQGDIIPKESFVEGETSMVINYPLVYLITEGILYDSTNYIDEYGTKGFKIDSNTSGEIKFDFLDDNMSKIIATYPFTLYDGMILLNNDTKYYSNDGNPLHFVTGKQIFQGQNIIKTVYLGNIITNPFDAMNLNYYGSGSWGTMSYDDITGTFYLPTSQGHRQPLNDSKSISAQSNLSELAENYEETVNNYYKNQNTVGINGPGINETIVHFNGSGPSQDTYNNTRYARIDDIIECTVETTTNNSDHVFHMHISQFQPIKIELKQKDGTYITLYEWDYVEYLDVIYVPAFYRLTYRLEIKDRPNINTNNVLYPGGIFGRWLAHCHMTKHAYKGMMMEFIVLDKYNDLPITCFPNTPAPESYIENEKLSKSDTDGKVKYYTFRIQSHLWDFGGNIGEAWTLPLHQYVDEYGNILPPDSHGGSWEPCMPGPTITGNLNDIICVTIQNRITNDGHFVDTLRDSLMVHWHGVDVANCYDGTPVTQYPIKSGTNFTYKFKVIHSGSFWYHSHYGSILHSPLGVTGLILFDDNTTTSLRTHKIIPHKERTFAISLSDMSFQNNREIANKSNYVLEEKITTINPPPQGYYNANDLFIRDILGVKGGPTFNQNFGDVLLINNKNKIAYNDQGNTEQFWKEGLRKQITPIIVQSGESMAFYLLNSGLHRIYKIRLEYKKSVNGPWYSSEKLYIIGTDGGLLDEARQATGTFGNWKIKGIRQRYEDNGPQSIQTTSELKTGEFILPTASRQIVAFYVEPGWTYVSLVASGFSVSQPTSWSTDEEPINMIIASFEVGNNSPNPLYVLKNPIRKKTKLRTNPVLGNNKDPLIDLRYKKAINSFSGTTSELKANGVPVPSSGNDIMKNYNITLDSVVDFKNVPNTTALDVEKAYKKYEEYIFESKKIKRSPRWTRFFIDGLVALDPSTGHIKWYDSPYIFDSFYWLQVNKPKFNNSSLKGSNGDNVSGATIVTLNDKKTRRIFTSDKGAHVSYYNADDNSYYIEGNPFNNYENGIIKMVPPTPNYVTVGIVGLQGGSVFGSCSDGNVYITHQVNIPIGSDLLVNPSGIPSILLNDVNVGYISDKVIPNDQSIVTDFPYNKKLIHSLNGYLVAIDCTTGLKKWVCPLSSTLDVLTPETDLYNGVPGISDNGPVRLFGNVAVVGLASGKVHFVDSQSGQMLKTMAFAEGAAMGVCGTKNSLYLLSGWNKWFNANGEYKTLPPSKHMYYLTLNGV